MNKQHVDRFIALASSASQIEITLPGGFQEISTVMVLGPEKDGTLLRLIWNQQRCETLLTAGGIEQGRWEDDAFHCNDKYDKPMKLRLLAISVLRPAVHTGIEPERSSSMLDAGCGEHPSMTEDGPESMLENGAVLDFLRDVINRSDTMDAEAELTWRLLCTAINILDDQQLEKLLGAFRARLIDSQDDTKDLTTMPLTEMLAMITNPETPNAIVHQ